MKRKSEFTFCKLFAYCIQTTDVVNTRHTNIKTLKQKKIIKSDSWWAVYGTDLSCSEKLAKASAKHDLKVGTNWSQPLDNYVRSHFWFWAVVNCDNIQYSLDYEITAVQPDGQELSCEGKFISFKF